MSGAVDVETGQEEAGQAWERLDELGGETKIPESGRVFFAGEAAVQALFEVLGDDPFEDIDIDEQITDEDLDPWCSDTAHWAVTAWAGWVEEPQSDRVRRREFWEWWLTRAVPEVWHTVS